MGVRAWLFEAVLLSRRGVALGCAVLVALLGLNALVFYRNTQTLLSEQHWVTHTQQVLADINGAQDTITSAESAQRGYILTGDATYLQAYHALAAASGPDIARLRGDVADNALQIGRVDTLRGRANEKLADLSQTVELRQTGQNAQARAIVMADRGKVVTKALQGVFGAIKRTELELLHKRNVRAGNAASTATITLILATAVDAALLAGVLLAIQGAYADRARVADERGRLLAQARQARDEAESAVRARDDFLSLAAHELRTPLTSLLGNTQLLQAHDDALTPRDQRLVAAILRGAERLRGLAEYLLDASRLKQERLDLDPRTLDLTALTRHCVAEVRETVPRHTLRVAATEEDIVVAADPARLRQALHNLLDNAVKYSPEGGEVLVTVGRAGDRARVSVGDHGIGIPADALANVFDRFYRAPNASLYTYSGLGLGLYVVREIVVQHGGTITVESMEGENTTFTIDLPLAPHAAKPPTTTPPHTTAVETPAASEDQGS